MGPRQNPADTSVFILCGGIGTRLKEETEFRPKPMVPIGEHPILWHLMHLYARWGFRRFILCLGFKAAFVKDYFSRWYINNCDCTLRLNSNEVTFHEQEQSVDWEVTLADTGELAMTGSRVAQAARKYLGNAEHFAVTYGDGLTDANLASVLQFHLDRPQMGTVLGVNPPSRFGELRVQGDRVIAFEEKPEIRDHWINGGFFFFHRSFLPYLSDEESCVLEREPLVRLARDGQLNLYQHRGFWASMDTQRDRDHLTALVKSGTPPWFQ